MPDHSQPDHSLFRQIIDQSLAQSLGGAPSPQDQQTLREHLPTCAACQHYLDASSRAIAALGDFSFAIDPALEGKVLASIAARAQQLEAASLHRRRLWTTSLLAVVLTIVGSIAASQLGTLAAPALHIDPAQLHLGLATFWIAPSVLICLLLLLPGFQTVLGSRKGLSL
jgi:predicted anti-sigma-YlaC factor YlaD